MVATKRAGNDSAASRSLADTIDESFRIVAPSWPLQSTVAVNPFWFLRDRDFFDVTGSLSPILHTNLFMPLQYYLEQYSKGIITPDAIRSALEKVRATWSDLPRHLDTFIRDSHGEEKTSRAYLSFAEHLRGDPYWKRVVASDIGKYAAAFFDDRQAIAAYPWQSGSFWKGWLEAQAHDRAMMAYGAEGFRDTVRSLQDLSPVDAITTMLATMGIQSRAGQLKYLQRLMASVLGWATQFKYHEWQKGLGYTSKPHAQAIGLLAVRMAYDFGLFVRASEQGRAAEIAFWQITFNESNEADATDDGIHRYHYVWQLAFELSYQTRLSKSLNRTGAAVAQPDVQMAFCIDVRSEMIRRHIEQEDEQTQTVGFAGFFGLPLDFKRADESEFGHRLPVLLAPTLKAKQAIGKSSEGREARQTVNHSYVRSFFRNMRKGPFSSFLYVELFGILSIINMISSTFLSLIRRLRGRSKPTRFDERRTQVDHTHLCSPDGAPISDQARAEQAMGILRHMGLGGRFAPLVLLVGHGSVTVNNAFGSALDCGACGGHAGDANVRLLASILNDPRVREHIERLGTSIPHGTRFVPAVHETVTDEVYILDEESVPGSHRSLLDRTRQALIRASRNTRRERQTTVSEATDRHVTRRPRNWSELRPEWGLTGNAAFIVAPRERTRGVNLASRSFLHDYDWSCDEGFKTLELIMTAPMVVTNWINLQYYSSTVATGVYGSGNKVIHNLVNEMGVLEGNGGDLRVGLPLQSVHDGKEFVHQPLRLSVFIEAPRREIERIVKRHDTVRELVDNGWVHLLHIDPKSLAVSARQPQGKYVPL